MHGISLNNNRLRSVWLLRVMLLSFMTLAFCTLLSCNSSGRRTSGGATLVDNETLINPVEVVAVDAEGRIQLVDGRKFKLEHVELWKEVNLQTPGAFGRSFPGLPSETVFVDVEQVSPDVARMYVKNSLLYCGTGLREGPQRMLPKFERADLGKLLVRRGYARVAKQSDGARDDYVRRLLVSENEARSAHAGKWSVSLLAGE